MHDTAYRSRVLPLLRRPHSKMLQQHPSAATATTSARQNVGDQEEVDENQREAGVEHDRPDSQHIVDETDAEKKRREVLGAPLLSSLGEYLDNPPSCRPWPEARQECPKCRKRGRFYCCDCLVFVGKPDGVDVPMGLRLPLEVS